VNRELRIWGTWLSLYAVVTVVASRVASFPEMRVAHGVLAYLLLIVGASREGSRALSAVMVALGYMAVDYYFVPPHGTFGRPSELDLIILIGFVAVAGVIAQLVLNLRQTATVANARAEEIRRLGAERLVLERQASRAEVIQEAERLKNALLASLSHDLRSPIMVMAMLADPESGVTAEAAMPRISEQARQLNNFLSTLSRFTAVTDDAGSALHVERHSADDLIGAALRASEVLLTAHPVFTPPVPQDSAHSVACDFTLSLQILGNLLQNAARYAPAGSTIELGSVAESGRIRITVSDSGPGIASGDVERVFRPLQRGSQGASAPPGTGMGLAIARTFARAQGGDLRYRARVGGGSHFDLVLPIAPAAERAHRDGPHPPN